MGDIIEQIEHPLISELRQQMEQQKENYEREIEEVKEEMQEKTGQIEDTEWMHSRQIDLISEIKDKYSEKDEKGKLVNKFTLENLLQDLSGGTVENYHNSNMLKELYDTLKDIEIPELVIKYIDVPGRTRDVNVPFVPKKLKDEIISVLNKY